MEKVHGGDIYSYDTEMIDFSANINPLGMAENIKNILLKHWITLKSTRTRNTKS